VAELIPRRLGLGRLGTGIFVQNWNRNNDGAVEYLRRYVDEAQSYWDFGQCTYGARCLLESDLSPEGL
jgi:hypothetical protein